MHTTATKQKILDMARSLGAQKGLDTLSLGELADAVGITKASIFAHFGSKKALIDELYRQFDSYGSTIAINLEGNAGEVLERAVVHWLDFFTTDPMRQAWRIISQQKYTDERALVRFQRLKGMVSFQCQAILESLSESGKLDIPEPDLASSLFSSTLLGYIEQETIDGSSEEDWKIQRLVTKFAALFTRQDDAGPRP